MNGGINILPHHPLVEQNGVLVVVALPSHEAYQDVPAPIFGEKAREVRDTSLKVPHGESGIVVDAKVFTREAGDVKASSPTLGMSRVISSGPSLVSRESISYSSI